MRSELSHKNNKDWMRLMYKVLEEAKEVKRLGGGKVRFVAFAERGKDDEDISE